MSKQSLEECNYEVLAFNHAPYGIIYSEYRIIICANEAFAAMFGYPAQDLQGMSMALFYPSPDEYESIGATGHNIMKDTGKYDDERMMARADGELFWCRVSGNSLTAKNPFARAVWCFSDISAKRNLSNMTDREKEVAMLTCQGKTAKEIARQLNLSPRTVETYGANLRRKLGVKNTAQLVNRIKAGGTDSGSSQST